MIEMGTANTGSLQRRTLTADDLERMRIPERFWKVCLDGIDDTAMLDGNGAAIASPKQVAARYMGQLSKMRQTGMGLLLWGPNGSGKTGLAIVIAKEYRRQFNTVLYIAAADLKRMVASKEWFDSDETYWQRAVGVDVLVLDDLGKGSQDAKGFGKSIIDELIRERNAAQKVTFITTNLSVRPKSGSEEASLANYLMPSTMDSLREHVIPIQMRGESRRGAFAKAVKDELLQL